MDYPADPVAEHVTERSKALERREGADTEALQQRITVLEQQLRERWSHQSMVGGVLLGGLFYDWMFGRFVATRFGLRIVCDLLDAAYQALR